MKKRKLKKSAIYGLSISLGALLLGGLWYADLSNQSLKEDTDYDYVSNLFDENVTTVVNTAVRMMHPYTNGEVEALTTFYDYQDDEESQQNSIINYETTYIQNNGIAYGGIEDTFDVVSVLDGTVSSVEEDNLLGKIVTITHTDEIITTYQSLSEVTVKEGDQISQGTIIGKAGESNLEKDLGNHVLFEISINGKYVNPEDCYDKTIDQLKSN